MGFESLGRLCFAFSAAYLLLLLHAESSPRGNAICNFYKGRWVYDETYPIYDAKSCPFMRQEFDCQRYGRPDTMYLKYRWKPDGCELPSGNDWGDSPRKSCSGQAKPLNGSIYPAGPLAEQAIVKNVLNSMSKPVPLLDITLLSQLRIDAHPSKYNGIKFRNDCSHWCIAGLPDTWNQLLYASLKFFILRRCHSLVGSQESSLEPVLIYLLTGNLWQIRGGDWGDSSVKTMSKPVYLLDITLLSQLRKDAHPSVYNAQHSGNDCSHWCLAGLPDTWNQLLYAALI